MTDTDRALIINNYLTDKIKVTLFSNTRRTTNAFSKHTYTNESTNTNRFAKIYSNDITGNCT